MVGKIIWTIRAKEELFEILEYWNERNGSSSYSVKLNKLILNNLLKLIKRPHSGRPTDIQNVRVKLVNRYFVYYEVIAANIYVLSIRHEKRNPETLDL
jgi:toxin YoeB